MNILYLVPYVPNLIRVRPYNLIRNLNERGHRVTVLTLWSNEREREDIQELKKICSQVYALYLPRLRSLWNCARALPTRTPLQSVFCWQPALARILLQLIRQGDGRKPFDVVHVEHLRGVRFGLFLNSTLPAELRPPVVWDSVDSISYLFRQTAAHSRRSLSRWLTQLELGRTERYEMWLPKQFARVLVTSEADRFAFHSAHSLEEDLLPIEVLTNGVDLDYFHPRESSERQPSQLVISGKMSYHANVAMVLRLVNEIMPIIWERKPEVTLVVVGKDPPRELQALTQNQSISLSGTVKDIRPYLYTSAVAVAPILYGAGIQNKVLEAMATATPVVSTPQATVALRVEAGRDLLVAEEPAAFAEAVIGLLDDPQLRANLGQAGRNYVEKHHRWGQKAEQLEGIYLDIVQQRQAAFAFQ